MDMTMQDALDLVDKLLKHQNIKPLSDLQTEIFKGCWEGKTYPEIAVKLNNCPQYIKEQGAELWDSLSKIFKKEVEKKNFKSQLEQKWRSQSQCTENLTLKPNNPNGETSLYVKRPPSEGEFFELLKQPGSLIRIKAPWRMGKTSLVAQVFKELPEDYRRVRLSVRLGDTADYSNLDEFLQWFCAGVTRRLDLPEHKVEQHWVEHHGNSKDKCQTYFEKYLLAEQRPLILCIDELDNLFDYPVTCEFLSLLRVFYEEAMIREIWKKLRLVVLHNTDVYNVPHSIEQFLNVGVLIELREFTPEQVLTLAQQHGLIDWKGKDPEDPDVKKLMKVVGGHPYLIQLALSHLKSIKSITLDQLLEVALTDEGIYGDHLRGLWLKVKQDTELVETLRKVVNKDTPILQNSLQSIPMYKLHSMGLVKLEKDHVMPRCYLYSKYFQERLESLHTATSRSPSGYGSTITPDDLALFLT